MSSLSHSPCSLPRTFSEHTTFLCLAYAGPRGLLCLWSVHQGHPLENCIQTKAKINLSPMTLSPLHSKVDFTAVEVLVNTQVKWGSGMLCSSIKEHNLAFLTHESQASSTMPFHITCNVQSAKFGRLSSWLYGLLLLKAEKRLMGKARSVFCHWNPVTFTGPQAPLSTRWYKREDSRPSSILPLSPSGPSIRSLDNNLTFSFAGIPPP